MAKTHKVIISDEAGRNIQDAYLWIARSDEASADQWYDGLIAALGTLAHMPLRCPVAPETRLGLIDREIRQLLYGKNYWKYRVLFAVEKDRVLVAHVRHTARLHLGEGEADDTG